MAKKKSKSKSRGTTLGATYRAASTGVILASPALDVVQSGGAGTAEGVGAVVDSYRTQGKDFALGVAFHAIDQVAGQRLVGHNSALGRGSLTAMLPEAYAVFDAAVAARAGGAAYGTAQFSRTKAGFATRSGFRIGPSTKTYLISKYGGGLVRKVAAMDGIQPVVRPIKKLARGLGVTV